MFVLKIFGWWILGLMVFVTISKLEIWDSLGVAEKIRIFFPEGHPRTGFLQSLGGGILGYCFRWCIKKCHPSYFEKRENEEKAKVDEEEATYWETERILDKVDANGVKSLNEEESEIYFRKKS